MDYPANFMLLTGSRYANMRRRFGELPFTLNEFRAFLIAMLGGAEGITHCEYCNCLLSLEGAHVGRDPLCNELQLDHRVPVKEQGGSLGFENLAASCEPCNQQKGSMSYVAFMNLRSLANNPDLFTEIDRADLLGRLQSQLKLALREQARLKAERRSA